ncbi:hypothetical protein C8R42DRAFT_640010 [Lentinula raphanica]|nr:hypothetical protein C8R42DRAFT_640010 [Lentinula raphanica]
MSVRVLGRGLDRNRIGIGLESEGGNDETANKNDSNAYPVADVIVVKQNNVKDLVDCLARYQFVFSVTLQAEDRSIFKEVYSFLHDEILSYISFLVSIVLTYPRVSIGKFGWYVGDTITKACKDGHIRLEKPFEFNKHVPALNHCTSFLECTSFRNYLNQIMKVYLYLESGYLFICPSGSSMYLQGHPCVRLKLFYK